jgi:lactoylglutathione lyase
LRADLAARRAPGISLRRSGREKQMAKTIHSMIRVTDEARSLAFYKTAFGLDVAGRYPFETFSLIYLRNAEDDFELELTVNEGRDRPYDLGDGYGHLAVSVDDLDAEHARMKDKNLGPGDIKTMQRDGQPFARFFFISDPDGYKIEVLQRGGRFL